MEDVTGGCLGILRRLGDVSNLEISLVNFRLAPWRGLDLVAGVLGFSRLLEDDILSNHFSFILARFSANLAGLSVVLGGHLTCLAVWYLGVQAWCQSPWQS